MSGRRGGIPGPESRTGLVRPAMTEAEFDRHQATIEVVDAVVDADQEASPRAISTPTPAAPASPGPARGRSRGKSAARPRRIQRMFALEEELDKKLWLYAIHVGKDRSEVVNDLLRPLVQSMVLYDSRDRRASNRAEVDRPGEDAS